MTLHHCNLNEASHTKPIATLPRHPEPVWYIETAVSIPHYFPDDPPSLQLEWGTTHYIYSCFVKAPRATMIYWDSSKYSSLFPWWPSITATWKRHYKLIQFVKAPRASMIYRGSSKYSPLFPWWPSMTATWMRHYKLNLQSLCQGTQSHYDI